MGYSEEFIWILEDDPDCRFVYEQALDHRYKTRYFDKISTFENELGEREGRTRPSMIVADLMLNDGNFLNFISGTNSHILSIPFMIVSSVDDIDALRFCFQEGALDYMTKPFKRNELLVKIENILTRTNSSSSLSNRSRSGAVDLESHRSLTIDGTKVTNLTIKQLQLLSLFLESPSRIVTRQDILEKVWENTSVHPKTIDVHLYNLRRKIHDSGFIIRSEGGGRWSLLSDRIS